MGLTAVSYGSYGVMTYWYLGQDCPDPPGDNTVYSMAFPNQVACGCCNANGQGGGFCEPMNRKPQMEACDNGADVAGHFENFSDYPRTETCPQLLIHGKVESLTYEEVWIDCRTISLAAVLCQATFKTLPYIHKPGKKTTVGFGITWNGSPPPSAKRITAASAGTHYCWVRYNGHCYHVIPHTLPR